jgi:hypothetical protein
MLGDAMTTILPILLLALLIGCTSAPVKPVGQAVSSQPLAIIMLPGVVALVGEMICK